jgi:hypothetical protein
MMATGLAYDGVSRVGLSLHRLACGFGPSVSRACGADAPSSFCGRSGLPADSELTSGFSRQDQLACGGRFRIAGGCH